MVEDSHCAGCLVFAFEWDPRESHQQENLQLPEFMWLWWGVLRAQSIALLPQSSQMIMVDSQSSEAQPQLWVLGETCLLIHRVGSLKAVPSL